MRVVHVTAHGGPEVLELVDLPVPEPGRGEVLVKVLGVSLNHLDLWVRRGLPGMTIPLPHVPGCDAVGEVAGVGPGVISVQVGQRVVLEPGFTPELDSEEVRRGEDHLAEDYGIRGEHGPGFDSEYVVLHERYVFLLPSTLDPIQAAAAPLVFLTAWGMLMERARVRAGQTVLVLGAASGVGSAAIQIARAEGATVIATAGSEEKRALGRALGAEHVLDHREPGWSKNVKRLTGGRGADVVVEHVGPATWVESMRALARNGRLVTCGATTGPEVSVVLPHLFIKNQTILGSTMGPRSALPMIFDRLANGTYRTVVDRVLPMSDVRAAHAELEQREVLGKIVLVPSE